MRTVIVKRATFVFVGAVALCAALLAGCSSKSSSGAKTPEELGIKNFQKMGDFTNSPEVKINQFQTPQARAEYLKSLGTDSNFVPKEHVNFLEQQSKDPDPDVASAAKELLDKAK
jgi:hypothetical protein